MRVSDTPTPLAAALHGLAASAPVLLLLPLLLAALGPERDVMWYFRLHKNDNPGLRQVMFFITDWANWAMYAVWAGLLVRGILRGDKRLVRLVVTFAVVQFLINFLVVTGVKIAIGRARPASLESFDSLLSLSHRFHSFPSGHTAEFAGSVLPLVLWRRDWRLTLTLGAALALVGFSRIYLHEHYPTDVFFGWVFGAFAAAATYAFWRRGPEDDPGSGGVRA